MRRDKMSLKKKKKKSVLQLQRTERDSHVTSTRRCQATERKIDVVCKSLLEVAWKHRSMAKV
jgi:hypothetical protein